MNDNTNRGMGSFSGRMTRQGFLKTGGLAAAGLGAAAIGFGGFAGARGVGQALDDYEISHNLFFSTSPYGIDGGLAFSSTKCLYVTCGNQALSPVANAALPTGYSPVNRWVKVPGDDLFVPDFQSQNLYSLAGWDMDAVTGFTEAKLLEFLGLYGGIVLPPQFNPLGINVTLRDLAGVLEGQLCAGFYGPELPQTPIQDLSDAPRPSDFPNEEISALDSHTTLVEFTVPASPFQEYGLKTVVAQFMKSIITSQLVGQGYPPQLAGLLAGAYMLQQSPFLVKAIGIDPNYQLPIVAPADPVNSYKLRGWFIEGEGLESDGGALLKPLVIFSHGWSQSMAGTRAQCVNYRRMVYNLVLQGYNVLYYDHEAHGISEGWNRAHNFTPPSAGVQLYAPGLNPASPLTWLAVPNAVIPNPYETGNAVNIFHIIDQLAMKGLIGGATTTPIILYGISQGALLSAKAMQLRFATPGGLTRDYSGYDIRGIIDSDCMGASMKYLCDGMNTPLSFFMIAEATTRSIFNTMFFTDGDVHGSIPSWPGYLGLKAVYDYMSPDGVVAAYNRARGIKDMAMVKGWHDWGLLFEPNFSYTIKRIARFCRKVTVGSPAFDSYGTASLRNELCNAPDFDIGTLGTPPFEGRLFGAQNSLERLIENIMRQHPL